MTDGRTDGRVDGSAVVDSGETDRGEESLC